MDHKNLSRMFALFNTVKMNRDGCCQSPKMIWQWRNYDIFGWLNSDWKVGPFLQLPCWALIHFLNELSVVLVQTHCSRCGLYEALQCSICSPAFIRPERSFISDSFMSPGHAVDSCGQLHSSTASPLIGLLWIPGVSVTVHRSGLPPAS